MNIFEFLTIEYMSFVFFLGYRDADGLTALSIAAGKKHKALTEILASKIKNVILLINFISLFFN